MALGGLVRMFAPGHQPDLPLIIRRNQSAADNPAAFITGVTRWFSPTNRDSSRMYSAKPFG